MSIDSLQPIPNQGSSKSARRRTKVIIYCLIIGLALAATLLVLFNRQRHTLLPATPDQTNPGVIKSIQHYCTSAGSAIRCLDIRTGSYAKYQLPASVSRPLEVLPSPDGRKLLVRPQFTPIAHDQTQKLYITDDSFKVEHTLSAGKDTTFGAISWAGDNQIAFFQRADKTADYALKLYNIANKTTRQIGGVKSKNHFQLFLAADGKHLIATEATGDKLAITSIELSSHKTKPANMKPLFDKFSTAASINYDTSSNLFYISGSSRAGNAPALALARILPGAGALQLEVTAFIEDGQAYAPLLPVAGGMLASRQNASAATYGIVDNNGGFKDLAQPLPSSRAFGLAARPSELAPVRPVEFTATDYLYGTAEAPGSLAALGQSLTTSASCLPGDYNMVGLLSHDNSQAVFSVSECSRAPEKLVYYTLDNGQYRVLGSSLGMPSCAQKEALQLSDTVAPSCLAH